MLNVHLAACRAGADKVTAVEAVGHLADMADRIIARHGYPQVEVLHKDGRYVTIGPQADGRKGDMDQAADMLVFEVSILVTCAVSTRKRILALLPAKVAETDIIAQRETH